MQLEIPFEEYKVIDSEYSLSKTEKIIATGIKEKKYICIGIFIFLFLFKFTKEFEYI